MITGLVGFELIKYVQSKPLEAYRNSFVNLAVPLWTASEPLEPKKHTSGPYTDDSGQKRVRKCIPDNWTLWDKIRLEGDLTVQQLIDELKKQFELSVCSIACGSSLVYNAWIPSHKSRTNRKLSELWPEISKKPLPQSTRTLTLIVQCENEDDDTIDIEIPDVRLKFR